MVLEARLVVTRQEQCPRGGMGRASEVPVRLSFWIWVLSPCVHFTKVPCCMLEYLSICMSYFNCLKSISLIILLNILSKHALSLPWPTNPHRNGPSTSPTLSPTSFPLVHSAFTVLLSGQPQTHLRASALVVASARNALPEDTHPQGLMSHLPHIFYSSAGTDKLQSMAKLALLPIYVNELL